MSDRPYDFRTIEFARLDVIDAEVKRLRGEAHALRAEATRYRVLADRYRAALHQMQAAITSVPPPLYTAGYPMEDAEPEVRVTDTSGYATTQQEEPEP
jgi:hypothetical protein